MLSRKDSNGFFVYPVTDSIAPGYSDIIEQPMDFSTMKKKIDNNAYSCIADYRVCEIQHGREKLSLYKNVHTQFKQL